MILIGLTGKAGSGKDTVADYLVGEHEFIKLSMAGPLKAMLRVAGMPEPYNRENKEKPIEGFSFSWREAAQRLGTEFGRALDPELWIKLMARQIRHLDGLPGAPAGGARIVISDIRFDNEADMVRALGGQVWHIAGRAADLGQAASHASEAGVAYYPTMDATLTNDGSLQDLYWKAGAQVRLLIEQKESLK